ncbi:MAG: hypothetical protein IMY71_08750 [Bacteroidetes bacterium]|nr:hypothetical protein [Bacteroidota bacterium]
MSLIPGGMVHSRRAIPDRLYILIIYGEVADFVLKEISLFLPHLQEEYQQS